MPEKKPVTDFKVHSIFMRGIGNILLKKGEILAIKILLYELSYIRNCSHRTKKKHDYVHCSCTNQTHTHTHVI